MGLTSWALVQDDRNQVWAHMERASWVLAAPLGVDGRNRAWARTEPASWVFAPPLEEEHGRNHAGARMAPAWHAHEVPPGVGSIRESAHMALDGGEGTCGDRAWGDEGRNRGWLRMELAEVALVVREHGAALGEDDRTGGSAHKAWGAGAGTCADRARVPSA